MCLTWVWAWITVPNKGPNQMASSGNFDCFSSKYPVCFARGASAWKAARRRCSGTNRRGYSPTLGFSTRPISASTAGFCRGPKGDASESPLEQRRPPEHAGSAPFKWVAHCRRAKVPVAKSKLDHLVAVTLLTGVPLGAQRRSALCAPTASRPTPALEGQRRDLQFHAACGLANRQPGTKPGPP